jgi:hypothetical protein
MDPTQIPLPGHHFKIRLTTQLFVAAYAAQSVRPIMFKGRIKIERTYGTGSVRASHTVVGHVHMLARCLYPIVRPKPSRGIINIHGR